VSGDALNEEPESDDDFEDALSHKDDIPHVESFADGSSVFSGEVSETDNGSSLPRENAHEDCSAQDEMLSKGIEHIRKKLKSNRYDDAVKEALLLFFSNYKKAIESSLVEESDRTNNTNSDRKGFLKYISPDKANQTLLALKYPTIKTHKKETFLKTFKVFQELFARHCALVSCVSPDMRSEITVKALCSDLKEVQDCHSSKEITDGKSIYDEYLSNLKQICENVEYRKDSLFESLRYNLSYNPQKFITAVRGKYKEGVWTSGEDYNYNKLYIGFKEICEKELNILK